MEQSKDRDFIAFIDLLFRRILYMNAFSVLALLLAVPFLRMVLSAIKFSLIIFCAMLLYKEKHTGLLVTLFIVVIVEWWTFGIGNNFAAYKQDPPLAISLIHIASKLTIWGLIIIYPILKISMLKGFI